MPLPVIAVLGIIQGALVLKNTSVGFNKFIDCIVSDIDTKMIIAELKKALSSAYSNSMSVEEN